MPMPEDTREILSDPVAVELLSSRIPARLAYRGADGAPRVTPIWFHWNGEALILGTGPASHKARSLSHHPAVAVTIDSERPPALSLVAGSRHGEYRHRARHPRGVRGVCCALLRRGHR